MKKALYLGVSLVLLVCAQFSQAALELELTQGFEGLLPIAVTDFKVSGATKQGSDLTKVISDDLQNSGRFRVFSNKDSLVETSYGEKINYSYWRQKGVDSLLTGRITAQANDRYQIDIELLDVYKGDAVASAMNQDLLLKRQFVVKSSSLRRVAHHISDLIYQQLTGKRGVFSTRIAYVAVDRKPNQRPKYQLEVSDYDGHNAQPLLVSTRPIMSPSWSPDGKKLAYVSFENRKPEVFMIDVASGKRHLISSRKGINSAPAWAPDMSRLALVLSHEVQPKIYLSDLQGKNLKQLTHGYSIDTEPSWAPDGKSIIFTSGRGGGPQIYQLNLADNKTRRLTFKGGYNARASYAPDGKKIVMLHKGAQGGYTIATQDLSTGKLSVLTSSDMDESPCFAPNGELILYATHHQGQGVLGMVSADGRVKLRLPVRGGDVREPAWSPYLG